MKNTQNPEYLFEVSWEVCNKVGGIHTVISTKSVSLQNDLQDNLILIGPDLVKHAGTHIEFDQDESLFSDWIKSAAEKGIQVKAGRWKIMNRPVALLVDFSSYFGRKDEIFSSLWETYKLDSLSGQWDYIEPALFGYAVGEVIESFIRFYLNTDTKVIAQFHEWMTGTGALYLKNRLPQVATVFTTHATVLGRNLAGNKKPLYNNLENFNTYEVAKEFNIVSKQSLERISAHEADVFTTVSDITARECKYFLSKEVDIITPNGLEDSIIPAESEVNEKRIIAREKMLKVASVLLNEELPKDTFITTTGGRYEFRNKGIDLFIDAIAELKNNKKLNRPLVAFLLVPAHHYGPRKDLLKAMDEVKPCISGSKFLTHNLHDVEWDPIMQRIHKAGFTNQKEDKVKIIFVPSYLNGNDGIFDLPYYDLLMACDQTIYASYYEPWGYTPLESLVFGVPTVTTTLAGFGAWAHKECTKQCPGITVIERNDTNDTEVVQGIVSAIMNLFEMDPETIKSIRQNSFQMSQTALWRSLVFYYRQAYTMALNNAEERSDDFVDIDEMQLGKNYETITPLSNEPKWTQLVVKSNLPGKLEKLEELIQNIWWTWSMEAQELFEEIDPLMWRASDYNPFVLYEKVPFSRFEALNNNKKFTEKLDKVYNEFQEYMKGTKDLSDPQIAYFSMEFGFQDSIKLYSGGLGVLAGDYLKEASDAKVNIVAIGLLYRYGYFNQLITINGEQRDLYDYQYFGKLPFHPIKEEDGRFKTIEITLPGRIMTARLWELLVGRIKLILLDTDFDANRPEDREVTHNLYGGSRENRLKQELLLGLGGIRALNILGYTPDLYHSNEGHSAFIGLERIRLLMQNEQMSFSEAKEIVKASTLFTTHTPVPAGHDHFHEDLIRMYLGQYPGSIDLSWEKFMALGRANPNDWNEEFNMSYLAAHLAQEVNGVSMLHGAVTRDMFSSLWPGYLPEELHIGYVTNGVHWSTWTAMKWQEVYAEMFENDFVNNQLDSDKWHRIYDVDDSRVWNIKNDLRKRLIDSVKNRFKENWIKRHEDPKHIMAINNTLSDKVLTVVFARRFATYKRAHLLFRDIERLGKLMNNKDMPLQFIFAGKAHPHDKAGQDLIKMIVEISKRPEFLGKILFLQNYSIELAKLLVSGADIWLNTPTRPLEASGTSGEKAVMNGTLHFSVLDGWWVEGYQPDAGWALTNERTYENQHYQDDLDAEVIYSLFESEILPAYYNRNANGVPEDWVRFIKNNIANVSPKFTTRRMITDYQNLYYNKLYKRTTELIADDFKKATELAHWKKRMTLEWDAIEVLEVKIYNDTIESIETGTEYKGHVIMDLKTITAERVGVELLVTENFKDLVLRKDFEAAKVDGTRVIYNIKVIIEMPGTFDYGIRVYPKHELLPHRQDFAHLRWI